MSIGRNCPNKKSPVWVYSSSLTKVGRNKNVMLWCILENKAEEISSWRVSARSVASLQWSTCSFRIHPTAFERYGMTVNIGAQFSLQLIFGYLNCMLSSIVVRYSTGKRGFSTRYQKRNNCWKDPENTISVINYSKFKKIYLFIWTRLFLIHCRGAYSSIFLKIKIESMLVC